MHLFLLLVLYCCSFASGVSPECQDKSTWENDTIYWGADIWVIGSYQPGRRSSDYKDQYQDTLPGLLVDSPVDCCELCVNDPLCSAWQFQPVVGVDTSSLSSGTYCITKLYISNPIHAPATLSAGSVAGYLKDRPGRCHGIPWQCIDLRRDLFSPRLDDWLWDNATATLLTTVNTFDCCSACDANDQCLFFHTQQRQSPDEAQQSGQVEPMCSLFGLKDGTPPSAPPLPSLEFTGTADGTSSSSFLYVKNFYNMQYSPRDSSRVTRRTTAIEASECLAICQVTELCVFWSFNHALAECTVMDNAQLINNTDCSAGVYLGPRLNFLTDPRMILEPVSISAPRPVTDQAISFQDGIAIYDMSGEWTWIETLHKGLRRSFSMNLTLLGGLENSLVTNLTVVDVPMARSAFPLSFNLRVPQADIQDLTVQLVDVVFDMTAVHLLNTTAVWVEAVEALTQNLTLDMYFMRNFLGYGSFCGEVDNVGGTLNVSGRVLLRNVPIVVGTQVVSTQGETPQEVAETYLPTQTVSNYNAVIGLCNPDHNRELRGGALISDGCSNTWQDCCASCTSNENCTAWQFDARNTSCSNGARCMLWGLGAIRGGFNFGMISGLVQIKNGVDGATDVQQCNYEYRTRLWGYDGVVTDDAVLYGGADGTQRIGYIVKGGEQECCELCWANIDKGCRAWNMGIYAPDWSNMCWLSGSMATVEFNWRGWPRNTDMELGYYQGYSMHSAGTVVADPGDVCYTEPVLCRDDISVSATIAGYAWALADNSSATLNPLFQPALDGFDNANKQRDDCCNQCLNSPDCVFFDYKPDKAQPECNLYGGKQGMVLQPVQSDGFVASFVYRKNFTRCEYQVAKGDGAAEVFVAYSTGHCETRCRMSATCFYWTYLQGGGECRLLSQSDGACQNNDGAISGVELGPAPIFEMSRPVEVDDPVTERGTMDFTCTFFNPGDSDTDASQCLYTTTLDWVILETLYNGMFHRENTTLGLGAELALPVNYEYLVTFPELPLYTTDEVPQLTQQNITLWLNFPPTIIPAHGSTNVTLTFDMVNATQLVTGQFNASMDTDKFPGYGDNTDVYDFQTYLGYGGFCGQFAEEYRHAKYSVRYQGWWELEVQGELRTQNVPLDLNIPEGSATVTGQLIDATCNPFINVAVSGRFNLSIGNSSDEACGMDWQGCCSACTEKPGCTAWSVHIEDSCPEGRCQLWSAWHWTDGQPGPSTPAAVSGFVVPDLSETVQDQCGFTALSSRFVGEELVWTSTSIEESWWRCCEACQQQVDCLAWNFNFNITSDNAHACQLLATVDGVEDSEAASGWVAGNLTYKLGNQQVAMLTLDRTGLLYRNSDVIHSLSLPTVLSCGNSCIKQQCHAFSYNDTDQTCLLLRQSTGAVSADESTAGVYRRTAGTVECPLGSTTADSSSEAYQIMNAIRAEWPEMSIDVKYEELRCFNGLQQAQQIVGSKDLLLPLKSGCTSTECAKAAAPVGGWNTSGGFALLSDVMLTQNGGQLMREDECWNICNISASCIAASFAAEASSGGNCSWLGGTQVVEAQLAGSNVKSWVKGHCPYPVAVPSDQSVQDVAASTGYSWETLCCFNGLSASQCKDNGQLTAVTVPCPGSLYIHPMDACAATQQGDDGLNVLALALGLGLGGLFALAWAALGGVMWYQRYKKRKQYTVLQDALTPIMVANGKGKLTSSMRKLSEVAELTADKYKWLGGGHEGVNSVVVSGLCKLNNKRIAAKFYKNPDVFDHERQFYMRHALPRHVPEIYDVVESRGRKVVTALVMEHGDYSLEEWMAESEAERGRAKMKVMLRSVAESVAALHGAKVAHLNLQPSSIMWFNMEHCWKIIDFANWGTLGEIDAVPRHYNLSYTAPELLMDTREASSGIIREAADMWSLGCIAWQCLAGEPLFGSMYSDEQVEACLKGEQPLPFEQDETMWEFIEESQARRLVQNLLRREPDERWRISKVLDNATFQSGAGSSSTVLRQQTLDIKQTMSELMGQVTTLHEINAELLHNTLSPALMVCVAFEELQQGMQQDNEKEMVLEDVKGGALTTPSGTSLDGISQKWMYDVYERGDFHTVEAPMNLLHALGRSDEAVMQLHADSFYAIRVTVMCGDNAVRDVPVASIERMDVCVCGESSSSETSDGDGSLNISVRPLHHGSTRTRWQGFGVWNSSGLPLGPAMLNINLVFNLKFGVRQVELTKVVHIEVHPQSHSFLANRTIGLVGNAWKAAPEWVKMSANGITMFADLCTLLS